MLLQDLLIPVAGTTGVLTIMGGMLLFARPRRIWESWFALEHRWRRARFGGDWTHLERALHGRGYFWVPDDVTIHTPDDIYAYALSDRFWRTKYSWFVRVLSWYAGLLLIFIGLFILTAGIHNLP